MLNGSRRGFRVAALASLVLAASAALAQETNTVGPPQLKDFQLPGERTTPPSQAPAPAPAAPAPAATRPASTGTTPAPAPAARRDAPSTRRDAPVSSSPASSARAAPRNAAPPPAAAESPPAAAAPPPAAAAETVHVPVPPPMAPAPAPAARPSAASEGSGWTLWLLGVPVLLALGAFLFLRRRRGLAGQEAAGSRGLGGALFDGAAPIPDEPAAAPAAPAAVAVAEPLPAEEPAPRAWLEIDIVPERAAATENETVVNYELVLRNAGAATARNIRIDARMFNASAEPDIADFFGGPIHAHSGSPHVTIPAGEELRLTSAIGMPKAEVRAIEIQGRTIFVPVVAINVAYDWEGGGGRSSRSWLVGREAATPSAKMGPFRLDLGPRIYRQVGRREAKQVMV